MTGSKSASEPVVGAAAISLGRIRLAVAAAALAMLALLALLPGAGRIGEGVFDLYQRISPRDLTASKVAVVEIDSESLRLIGPWPWSRYDMARLTERIGGMGAAAIGFDMLFPEADRQSPDLFVGRYPELAGPARAAVLALPPLDADFARALGRFPTVLARAGIDESAVDFGQTTYADAATLPVDATFAVPLPAGVAHWPQAIANIPTIEETSLGHGLINGDPDPDGVVRRVPLVGLLHGQPNTGFALELARIALGLDAVRPVIASGRLAAVRLGDKRLPADPSGRMRLHFGTLPPGATLSAVDLFRRGFDPRHIAGKVILVGVTGAGGTDVVTTPLASRAFGLHVQAQTVDAILRGGWLERPVWARTAELALGALLAAIAILLFPRLRRGWTAAVPLALLLLVIAASWAAFAGGRLLLDPLTPLLIGGAASAALFVGLFVAAGAAQRRLRAALLVEQLAAERAAGEMAAARAIQLGMLTPRAELAALDPTIELDAVLEPAREVGGDFYDAFRLADGRVAFLVGDVTGKGVPAALFMALAKALARGAIERRADDLAAAIELLDADLSRDNAEDMFVTLLAGIVDPTSGAVMLVNAGHENPLLRRVDGRVEEIALDGGPPVCAAPGFAYAVETLALAAGETLVIVTDGVTEAQDAAGDFFDRDRAIAALAGGGTIDALVRAVRAFEGGTEPSDDLTVLAVRRR